MTDTREELVDVTDADKLVEALREVRAIALSHSNYGHVEGNRRAFAIIDDLDQRIKAIKRQALSEHEAGEG